MKRKIRKKNNILKQEKGAVATLVLFTILMFVVILTGAYFTISTMQRSQLKSDMRIRDIYGKDVERIDSIYDEQAKYLPTNNEIEDDPITEEPELQELIETTDENQLKEKVTGDSSYGTGYEAWNAFDGIIDKDNNSWESTGGFPHYIQYKFDNAKTVKQIKFYPQNGSHAGRLPGQSVVSCSNDGTNYTTVFEGVLCQDVGGWQTIDIQNTQRISGQYWKIEISGTANGETPASVGEMVLIGY